MRKIFKIILILTISIFTFAQDIKPSGNLISGKLNNGIRYYFVQNSFPKNKASINLIVDTGSLNEKENERGGAHYLEHMAFNGTEKYPKNELIKYLESIGLKFGHDLNAYTSFSETVYKLEIPSNKEDLKTALDVLHQWAYHITLTSEDVDKERGIITEEWRGRQGLRDRIFNEKGKRLFSNSIFMDRLPIGTYDSISALDENILKEYYETWYTPDRLSIVVVGDFTQEQVVSAIEEKFAKTAKSHEIVSHTTTNNDNNISANLNFLIPETSDSWVVFKDKEITTARVNLSHIERDYEINNLENLKKSLIETLYFEILNTRISQLTKMEKPLIISGAGYSYPLTKGNKVLEISFSLKDEDILKGYSEVYSLLKTMGSYAPNESELTGEKNEILAQLKLIYNNKESQSNHNILSEVHAYHRYGTVYLNPKDSLDIYSEVLKNITTEDILKYGASFYNKERLRFMMLSKNDTFNNITEEALKNAEETVRKLDAKPWENIEFKELEVVRGQEGTILKRTVENSGTPFETVNFTLSNGINVIFKNTNFESDKIYLEFFKKEGDSVEDKIGYLNSIFTPYIINNSGISNLDAKEAEMFMKGKNFSISPYITHYTQGFSIVSDNENLKYALDSLTGLLTEKRFDDTIFKSIVDIQRENIKNRINSPSFHFSQAIKTQLYGDNFRKLPLEEGDLGLITRDKILDIYNRKFSNFHDYTLVVVGSISKEKLEDVLIKYFSSLPSDKSEENIKNHKELVTVLPSSISKTIITKGEDNKSQVALIYPIRSEYSNDKRVFYSGFNDILRGVLLEEIREKNSQVYSISSSINFQHNNFGDNFLQISFTTDYKNVDAVIENVKTALFSTLKGDFKDSRIENIITNYNVNYETELSKNSFWSTYLTKKSFSKEHYDVESPENFAKMLTKENILKSLQGSIAPDNYIEVILNPEKISEQEKVSTEDKDGKK